jgi:hypothetical protein
MEVIQEASPSHTAPTGDALALLDTLDVVSWANTVLAPDAADDAASGSRSATGSTRLAALDKRLAGLLGALDLAAEETSGSLERALDALARTAPRLTYDLHFARDGARALDGALKGVHAKADAAAGDERTSAALSRLALLDTVQARMRSARDVLREAERWGGLEADVGSLLAEGQYAPAAARLAEADASLALFAHTPELPQRRALLVSLQNQLEAALSAALVAAIDGRDVDQCKAFFVMFGDIQREAEFRVRASQSSNFIVLTMGQTYYYGARRAALVELWSSASLSDVEGGSSTGGTQTLSAFLVSFFTALLTMLQDERSPISSIFPDPASTMSALLASTMSAMQPSFGQRLQSAAAHHGAQALSALIVCLKATEDFAVGVDKLMQKLGISSESEAIPSIESTEDASLGMPQRPPARRRSDRKSQSRRSISNRLSIVGMPSLLGAGAAGVAEWERVLFEPFAPLQADYGALERRALDAAVRAARSADARPADLARALREQLVDILGAAEDALARCAAFTHGFGAPGLVAALDGALALFVDSSRAELAGAAPPVVSGGRSAYDAELADLDYGPADWTAIQAGLHILGAARALDGRLGALERLLVAAFAGFAPAVRNGAHVPGTTQGELALLAATAPDIIELHALLVSASEGDLPAPPRSALLSPPPGPSARPSPGGGSIRTLVAARASLAEYARAAQTSLQSTLLGPLRAHLAGYPALPLWTATPAGAAGGRGPAIPSFSLSPSPPVQRVTEGLLNLPRLFEAYADDGGLSFSLGTLPHLDVALLVALAATSGPDAEDEATPSVGHARRSPSLSLRAPPAASPASTDSTPPLAPEAVSSAWLASLGSALVAHVADDVLPRVHTLSGPGAAQLAADCAYLVTIVQALNAASTPLERWRAACEMDEVELRRAMATSAGSEEDRDVVRMVGRMRGWAA